MNLEEKAKVYSERFWIEQNAAKENFIEGYEEAISDLELLTNANPKMSASDLIKALKEGI